LNVLPSRPECSPAADRRLKRESSANQVVAHVRGMIMSGSLSKGERLRPDEIADDLGLSRIPVREALIALEQEGWVKFESNRGAYVAGTSAEAIADHYELRGLVFGLIGRRAAELATDVEVAALGALHRAMRTAGDVESFAALNDELLGRVFAIAKSPRLIAALMVSAEIIPERFFELVPTGRRIQQKGLAAFLRALTSRSADDADRALRVLQRRQGVAVIATLTATGLVPEASPTTTHTHPYT